jgi:hypothetical protein
LVRTSRSRPRTARRESGCQVADLPLAADRWID